jgi:hypothetical protein
MRQIPSCLFLCNFLTHAYDFFFLKLGALPDKAWQEKYLSAVRVFMPASSFEELSLMAYAMLHFGMQPDAQWLQALLKETLFKMEEVIAIVTR